VGQVAIPGRYKCGPGIWIPLSWGTLPSRTVELVLSISSFGNAQRVPQGGVDSSLVAASGIIGLKPMPKTLNVGNLPRQAASISVESTPTCPSPTAHPEYTFRLFALGANHRITKRTLSSDTPVSFALELERNALAVGQFSA
jgi:hypothetical protein